MAYCEERAVPHSHFLGGPNRWTAEDRAKVLAFRIEKGAKCGNCGTAPWEWAVDPFAYEAEVETCQGCLRLDAKREDVPPGDTARKVVLTHREVIKARELVPAVLTVSPVEARRRARAEARGE